MFASLRPHGLTPFSALLQVEAEEAKHGQRGPLVSEEAFPSLGEAIKEPAGKGKKAKKGTKLSLNEFSAFSAGRARQQPSDKEILLSLPKGSSGLPKEDRDSKGLGGGFKDYGGNRGERGELMEGGSKLSAALGVIWRRYHNHLVDYFMVQLFNI
jgi:hypothetical protein